MEGEKKSSGAVIWSVIVLIVAVVAYGGFKYIKKEKTVADTEVSNGLPVPTPVSVPEVVATSYLYKDGSYSAAGEYLSPGGLENIGVSLTLKDDVITDATVEVKSTRPESKKYQTIFSNNYKSYVVGKKISDLKLDKVSGSSLTPKGFNAALEIIKTSAKV